MKENELTNSQYNLKKKLVATSLWSLILTKISKFCLCPNLVEKFPLSLGIYNRTYSETSIICTPVDWAYTESYAIH